MLHHVHDECVQRTGWNISWVEMNDWRKAATFLTNDELDLAIVDSGELECTQFIPA